MAHDRSHAGERPSGWVARFTPLIVGRGAVLDLACGRGRHARFLADRGFRVTAVDRDPEALAAMAGCPDIQTVMADLEAAPWPFAADRFDAIVVTRYLHRPLFPHLIAGLCDGGMLIYETFMSGNERFGKPSNPDFLLRSQELLRCLQPLEVIAYEQGIERRPVPCAIQRVAARRGSAADIELPPPVAVQID